MGSTFSYIKNQQIYKFKANKNKRRMKNLPDMYKLGQETQIILHYTRSYIEKEVKSLYK